MTMTVHCIDVGYECEGVLQAESEEELLQQVAEHSKTVHSLEEVRSVTSYD